MNKAALLSFALASVISPAPAWSAEASPPEEPAVDRHALFISDTIANLRGLDPVFPVAPMLVPIDRRHQGRTGIIAYPSTPPGEVDPAATLAVTALPMPASWNGAAVSERRACAVQGCSNSADLLFHRADGSTRVFFTRLTGEFIPLPRSQQIVDCAAGASTSDPGTPSIVDLDGTRTMLPSHPGPLRHCASTGTGDQVLLVYGMIEAGKSWSLARVFDADGALLAEGAFEEAGTLRFKAGGRRHSVAVPGP